ncbi:MAG: uroporphyrinogen decarboxylase family protein [Oscillospiraceae bacterium]
MSGERARRAIRGEKTDRIPFMETPAHIGFLKKVSGIDPLENLHASIIKAMEIYDIDMPIFGLPESATTNDPNQYGVGATQWRHEGSNTADILSYDPIIYRNLENCDEKYWENDLNNNFLKLEKELGERYVRQSGTFTTCMHYAAEDLDFEEFLCDCVLEEDAISKMLERCEKLSTIMMSGYAKTNVELMICHDDIANSSSMTVSAEWLRRNVIPRYKRIYKPLLDAKIPVIFMSDGNYMDIIEDIKNLNVSGFFLDTPCMDLKTVVEVCGKDMIYLTGPTPATLNMGTVNDVKDAVKELAELARDLPRFFFHMPGGFTHNTPTENVVAYFDACLEFGKRN